MEVEAIVVDYMDMLAAELQNKPYNKTSHRHALSAMLSHRSDGSIERKHQNISAILIELGYPYISGYKPLGNYQRLLFEVVSERLAMDQSLVQLVAASVEEPATLPKIKNILNRLDDPPLPPRSRDDDTSEPPRPAGNPAAARVNYLEREARNSSLGLAGELFVMSFERARLAHLGRKSLADRVEHISVTLGDGAGFDVRSFDADGKDRLIEVKTTAYGKSTPFFVSRNEVELSLERDSVFHVYRVFEFRKDPRFYTLKGAIERACKLAATQFIARVA